MSNQLNICQIPEQTTELLELKYILSLSIWPYNYATAKNYAFMLEYTGYYYNVAKSIYLDCYLLTNDAGCHLHHAMVSQIVSYSIEQTQYIYVEMLRQLFLMV